MLVPITYTRVSGSGAPDSRADTRPAIDPCACARPAIRASAPATGMSARRRPEATIVKRILSVLLGERKTSTASPQGRGDAAKRRGEQLNLSETVMSDTRHSAHEFALCCFVVSSAFL